MSAGFVVPGPCTCHVTAPGLTAYAELGFSDNDDLFSVDIERMSERLEATDTGREPAEIVFVGSLAVVTGTLTKWDDEILRRLETMPGEDLITAEGARGAGVIGTLVSSELYGVKLLPTTASKRSYEFKACFIDGANSLRIFDFGNTSQKLGFQFIAKRDSSGDLYTTATTA